MIIMQIFEALVIGANKRKNIAALCLIILMFFVYSGYKYLNYNSVVAGYDILKQKEKSLSNIGDLKKNDQAKFAYICASDIFSVGLIMQSEPFKSRVKKTCDEIKKLAVM